MEITALVVPKKSSRCAVIIPTHKIEFLPIEKYCIVKTIQTLNRWDIFFALPESLTSDPPDYFSNVKSIKFEDEHFINVDQYNRFRLSTKLYEKFLLYDRLLICEPDSIVMSDQIDRWVDGTIDYVGAPWFNLLTINPNFYSTPDFNGFEYKLDVGNGGLCMVNPRSILYIISKHIELFKEFSSRSGGQLNSDALYAFIGLIDPEFKLASRNMAVEFSLELDAKRAIRDSGKFPMGFHAMYKYDLDLWRNIFPDSPDPFEPNKAASPFSKENEGL